MVFFFQKSEIIYPFPTIPEKIDEDISGKNISEIHQLISFFLFFQKEPVSSFLFQKRIFKKHSIEINLYEVKHYLIVQKILDYSSNEYFLSLYGLNSLRNFIPTFSYTFFQKKSKELWIEYQNGKTLLEYLKEFEKKSSNNIQLDGYSYLSIFFQIICSLEVAQENLLFTHHDLHLENIIIKKEKKKISFPIHDKNYIFRDQKYLISIIDFEHSCIRKKKKIINSIQSHLFPYGYLSIFFSSVDILRYLLCFQYNFFQYSLQKSHFLSFLFQFHQFILCEFYKFSFLQNKENIKHALNYHSTFFFNTIFQQKIHKTPYELLLFLQKKKSTILDIFSIHNLPFDIEEYSPTFINFSSLENKKSLSCFIQFIIYFEQFYTIRNFVEIKKQYPCIQQYQSSFEYYRNKGEIPSTLYKKSLKIYRYFHSIEQLILLNEKKPCIHLSINLKKLIYFYKN